jgi:hypothetical protein
MLLGVLTMAICGIGGTSACRAARQARESCQSKHNQENAMPDAIRHRRPRWPLLVVIPVLVALPRVPVALGEAATAPSAPPHVLVVVEENHSIQQIIGNRQAPYINGLARQYGLATHWSDLSHPSLPNYLGLVSGSIWNNPPDTTPQDRMYTGPTFVDELAGKGIDWRAYMEDMPRSCDLTDQFGPARYDVNHNPFMYFKTIRSDPRQCNRVVPFTQFGNDLSNGTAPPFLWLSPNLLHDMHDGTIAQGDQWLRQWLPRVLASQWYKDKGTIILTWDEGQTTEQVATLVISASTPHGARLTTGGTHYGTLRTLEKLYGVGYLGASANAANNDLVSLVGTRTLPTTTTTQLTRFMVGEHSPQSKPVTVITSSRPSDPFVEGVMRFRTNNWSQLAATGFNASSDGNDPGTLRAQRAVGLRGLVWMGEWNHATCSWEYADSQVVSIVQGVKGSPNLAAYELGDEPLQTPCRNAPAAYSQRTALVHRYDPTGLTMTIDDELNNPSGPPPTILMKGTVDILGFDVYPCQVGRACQFGMIDSAIKTIHAQGISRWWAVIQDFEGQGWRFPTSPELTTEFSMWRPSGLSGYLVFAWDYLGHSVTSVPANVQALKQANASF